MPPPALKHPSPLIIGVSGHRDLHASCVERVKGQLHAFFDELGALAPNTPIRVMTGMAEGADMLVASVALEHDLAVDAVLPMPLEHYSQDFTPATLTELHRLLEHPNVTQLVLDPPTRSPASAAAATGPERDALYVNLADALARKTTLLIVLWNGEFSALAGGTADTFVRYLAADRGSQPATEVSFVEDDGSDLLEQQLVYWLYAPRSRDRPAEECPRPCFLSGLGESVLRRSAKMPSQLHRLLMDLDRYNREFAELQAMPYASPPDTLLRDLPGSIPLAERAYLRQIDMEYGKADALAVLCQFHSHRLFRWFSYMAAAMGLLFLVYAKLVSGKVFLLAYLALLLVGLVVFHALKSRHWFSKHLAYRALAETMRTKFYLRLSAADRQVSAPELIKLAGIDQFIGFGWITNCLKNVEPLGDRRMVEQPDEDASLDVVRRTWIESQLGYFRSKVGRLERTHKRLEHLKTALVYVLAMITIALVAFSGPLADFAFKLGFTGKDFLLFLMGLLPVWLGIWEIYEDKMATRELLWQYRNQVSHFSRANVELALAHEHERRVRIVASLGKDSLMESYLWTIHRFHREHEPPSAG